MFAAAEALIEVVTAAAVEDSTASAGEGDWAEPEPDIAAAEVVVGDSAAVLVRQQAGKVAWHLPCWVTGSRSSGMTLAYTELVEVVLAVGTVATAGGFADIGSGCTELVVAGSDEAEVDEIVRFAGGHPHATQHCGARFGAVDNARVARSALRERHRDEAAQQCR